MADSKLYPPVIEGTIPAFYMVYDKENNPKSATITVPFSMNRATNRNEVGGMTLRIKYIQKNEIIGTTRTTSINYDTGEAIFSLNSNLVSIFHVGQFYRIQLAYYDTAGNDGYFSTIGIIKCIAKPKVSIDGFVNGNINSFNNEFIGVYEQDMQHSEGDNTEKVYSYRFDLWDSQNNLIVTTGNMIHNTSEDIEYYKSKDIFYTNKYLLDDEIGYIQYTIKTLNGLILSTPKYKVMNISTIDMTEPLALKADLNFEEGYIEIQVFPEEYKKFYTGKFVITRGCAQDDYHEWDEIARFNLTRQKTIKNLSFRDFTIEQGITYKYALQQYNDYGVYSNRKLTKEIYADFEDMFLYDGIRQLKVRFNPKVSSFKPNIPEQKTETIGSKFPYFFRNGVVNYKEFPIAGLISYQMDEALLFLQNDEPIKGDILREDVHRGLTDSFYWETGITEQNEEYGWKHSSQHENLQAQEFYNLYKLYQNDSSLEELLRKKYKVIHNLLGLDVDFEDLNIEILEEKLDQNEYKRTPEKLTDSAHYEGTYSIKRITDLISDNIMSERYFKLKVLDWLTDGKPKLFRSPGEGNYIVRLMNTSLTPIDSLGRMLHNFTCTAYEIVDYNYKNLIDLGIVTGIGDMPNEELKFASKLCNKIGDKTSVELLLNNFKENVIEIYNEFNEQISTVEQEYNEALIEAEDQASKEKSNIVINHLVSQVRYMDGDENSNGLYFSHPFGDVRKQFVLDCIDINFSLNTLLDQNNYEYRTLYEYYYPVINEEIDEVKLQTALGILATCYSELETFSQAAFDKKYNDLIKIAEENRENSIAELKTNYEATIEQLKEELQNTIKENNTIFIDEKVQDFHCEDFEPGDTITVNLSNPSNSVTFIIGSTGALLYDFEDRTIESVTINQISAPGLDGQTSFYGVKQPFYSTDFHRIIHYSYIGQVKSKFDEIKSVKSYTTVGQQILYIGNSPYDIIDTIGDITLTDNVISDFGYKSQLLNVEQIKLLVKAIIPVYRLEETQNSVTYQTRQVNHIVSADNNIDIGISNVFKDYNFADTNDEKVSQNIYPHQIKRSETEYQPYRRVRSDINKLATEYQDMLIVNYNSTQPNGVPVEEIPIYQYVLYNDFANHQADIMKQSFNINDSVDIYLRNDDMWCQNNLGKLSSFKIGERLIVSVTYQSKIITYSFEDDDNNYEIMTQEEKEEYINNLKDLYKTNIEEVYDKQ